MTKGVCKLTINETRYEVIEGDIRIINPYELHKIDCSSWEHINLVVDMDFVKSTVGKRVRFQNIIQDGQLFRYLKTLFQDTNLTIDKKSKIFLEKLSKRYQVGEIGSDLVEPKKDKFKKAIKYIYKNANQPEINLEKLVSKVGFSKYHFLREFKKEFGITPYHYIHNIKINNARGLIGGDTPLSQVALECGFFDQSHFIKIYKKFYGHTPSKIVKEQ